MKSKEELEKEINEKNREALQSGDALSALMVHNLENFAYRYLETEASKNIKCQNEGATYWVESIEDDIYTALKWDNPVLKPKLIDVCKQYPGQKSKEIKIKLILGTTFKSDKEVTCFAMINWNFPNFEHSEKEICRIKNFSFNDPLELRNKHALLLEEVCEIF